MNFFKVLFIGLGGAGQRHLRILRQLLPESTLLSAYRSSSATPLLNSDFSVNEHNTVESAYGLITFDSLKSSFASYPDLTVISTPTAFHREPMLMAMEAGSGVLVEKPWAENLGGFAEFANGMKAKDLPFLISFQRRFHPLIARARQMVKAGIIGRPISATFTVYSHVPSWHQYENWRNLYAVRKDFGGGVLLTEIHEIDLAHWFFGVPDGVFCVGGNRGTEKLGVEDTVQMTLLYSDFSVQITLCFMHKKTSRNFHIAGSKGDIVWNEEGNQLMVTPFIGNIGIYAEPGYSNDSMFMAQANYFLNSWKESDTNESFRAAEVSLAIVDAAKCSMLSRQAETVVLEYVNKDKKA